MVKEYIAPENNDPFAGKKSWAEAGRNDFGYGVPWEIEGWRVADDALPATGKSSRYMTFVNEDDEYKQVPTQMYFNAYQNQDDQALANFTDDHTLRAYLSGSGGQSKQNGLSDADRIDDLWMNENEVRAEYATQAHPTSLMLSNPMAPMAMEMLGSMGFGNGQMPSFQNMQDMNQFMRMPFGEGLGGMFPDPRIPINPHMPEGSLEQPLQNRPGGDVPPGYGAMPNAAPSWAQGPQSLMSANQPPASGAIKPAVGMEGFGSLMNLFGGS